MAIVTKKELMESNSNYAQGGIAAVLDQYDSFEKHVEDTLNAGCYLNDKKAVNIMVREAPAQIAKLIDIGVGFSRAGKGLALTQEGGHSKRRIAFAHDTTGKEIERALIFHVRNHPRITVFESHIAVDLMVNDKEKKRVSGAFVLNTETNQIIRFFAKATIIATGGTGQVYQRNSNPKIATGDGVAMAERAGAEIRNMEFIQFHPTALAKKGKPSLLISETVRGEGGILKNAHGKTFMKNYDARGDLAPRDIVARSIVEEMKNGPVFLDIRHKGSRFIKKRFPYLYNQLWWYGIKMDKDLIPVAPAAHFTCGGIHTTVNGETSIPGLFAFGEVAHTGVHGANRLASNSLLECMVFSSRAVRQATRFIKKNSRTIPKTSQKQTAHPKTFSQTQKKQISILKRKIKMLMWKDVGIIRNPKQLRGALTRLNAMTPMIERLHRHGLSPESLELRNLHIVATLITKASLARKESIGGHYIESDNKTPTTLKT